MGLLREREIGASVTGTAGDAEAPCYRMPKLMID